MFKINFTFFKEFYLTIFIIFLKFGGWSHRMNAGFGVAIITLIEWWLLIAITSWIDMLMGTKYLMEISKWAAVVAFIALGVLNYWPLVGLGYGFKFVQEFANFKRAKRILLLVSAVTVLLLIVAFFAYSGFVHRQLMQHERVGS
jgi:hypothetical protein